LEIIIRFQEGTMITLGDTVRLLSQIRGCSFASIDATTEPSPGIVIKTTGLLVLLFTTGYSGYEKMVKKRLAEVGKDPDSFTAGELPWGERPFDNLSIIYHRDRFYLQTIPIRRGKSTAWIGAVEVDYDTIKSRLRLDGHDPSQGLPPDKTVIVRTFRLDAIDALRLMGEEITS
jgi:hypothetical protein